MADIIYNWIDLLWVPIAYFTVHKKHRWWAVGFVVICMIIMRLQVELMVSIGHPNGILPLIESHVNSRLLLTYSFFYVGFLAMAHYSPKTEGIVFMGACLGIFFMAFFTSSALMIL
jgi:hypothetical protein